MKKEVKKMIALVKKYDLLTIVTVMYITLPLVIFLLSWVKIIVGVPIIVVILYIMSRKCNFRLEKNIDLSKKEKIIFYITFSLLFVWLLFSGVGGFSYQNEDYLKHNAVLHDLIDNDNPVLYSLQDGNTGLLVYYIGYYLPSAYIGKLFGFNIANIFMFIYAYIGLSIGILWVFRNLKKISILPVIVLVMFGGLDLFGEIITKGFTDILSTSHKEFWIKVLTIQYSSITTLLYWVPQMFIPSFILTPMLLYFRNKQMPKYFYILMVSSVLWSPFVCVGLILFFLYNFFASIKKYGIKNTIDIMDVIGAALPGIVLILYIMVNINDIGKIDLLYKVSNVTFKEYLFCVILFCLIEFYVVFKIILRGDNKLFGKAYLNISVLILFFLVLFKYGEFNDLAMRVSIPSLLVLYIYFCNVLMNSLEEKRKILSIICIFYIFFASYSSATEILRSIKKTNIEIFSNYNDSTYTLKNFEEVSIFNQYISTKYTDSLFYKYLQKNRKF